MVEWTNLTYFWCMQRSTVKTVGWQSGVASEEVEQDVDDLELEDTLDIKVNSKGKDDDDDDDDDDADADADVDGDADADDDDEDEDEEEDEVVSVPLCIVSSISCRSTL